MLRHRQLYPYLLFVALSVALATTLTTPRTAQSGGPVRAPFLTAVSKNGVDLELRSEGKIMVDEMASGHVMLGPEVPPIQNFFAGQGRNPLRGPNTQVNDPALDNIQIFPGFRPFLHFTQSETTVAAHEKNIVVSYNTSAGITLEPFAPGILSFSRILFSGYSFSSDGGKTFTSGFVPPVAGGGPFTFGDGVVAVDRRGNFYYASLGETADGLNGAVVVNVSTDDGHTFLPGVIAGVDDGSDKNWIAVGPDPDHHGRDNVYVTWTSFSNTGSAVAFAVSKDGGQTFRSRIIFAPGPDPDPTHPQNFVQSTNPVVDQESGRLYIPFARFSNSDTDFLQMMVSDDAGKTFSFVNFNIPGTPDPTLAPLVQPGTFEDCGSPGGGFRLAIVQGSDIGGGRFGFSRFIQSSRTFVQPALAVSEGNLFLAYNASDSPFFGDPTSGSNILLLRSTDGGQTWRGPRQVNPSVAGEPRHVYPAIAADEDGKNVGISYYTQHADGTVDLDLVVGKLKNSIRITSQSFDLVPSNIPIPIATLPFRTTNFDRNVVPCYDLGEYVGLFNNGEFLYAAWGDNRNLVTEPTNPLDPISGQTHAQPDTFFQRIRLK